jgi:molybdate transport system regulatory protein
MRSRTKNQHALPGSRVSLPTRKNHGRIVSVPEDGRYLDAVQLNRLEQSFRQWVDGSPRADVRLSRLRLLLIFLLIRYTGAKLNEVLSLDPYRDIDPIRHAVFFLAGREGMQPGPREVQISSALSEEIQNALGDPVFRKSLKHGFQVDPGFVRRKCYERAEACGFSKHLGTPEMIRKARAVELMQSDMPLPAVQLMLGHSTPNLTSSYVSFSGDEIRQVARFFMERESNRKTSARNSFFGKIQRIVRGDIQSTVELLTAGGHPIMTVITNDSLDRLGLKTGRLISAEVKAPWVILQRGDQAPECSAENRFRGIILKITTGQTSTEYVVRISDGTELCAIVSTAGGNRLGLNEKDSVWAMFSCYSVVLHVD